MILMISTKGRYALRFLVDVAERQDISEKYLAQFTLADLLNE